MLRQPLLGSSRGASASVMPGSLGVPGTGKKLSVLPAAEGGEGSEAPEHPGIDGGSPRSAVPSQARTPGTPFCSCSNFLSGRCTSIDNHHMG